MNYLREGVSEEKLLFVDILYTERYNNNIRRIAMDNKQLIMEAALELFYHKGYDAVGIQEIVEKAGITKPTLYYYFGSKYGLLENLLNTQFEEFRARLVKAAVYKGDLPMTLYHLASAFIDYAISHKKTYMLMMALFYSAKDNDAYRAVKPLLSEFYHIIVDVFEQAEGQLGNMRGRQRQFAIGFIGILSHYILVVCDQTEMEIIVSDDTKRSLVHQFMYGIYS